MTCEDVDCERYTCNECDDIELCFDGESTSYISLASDLHFCCSQCKSKYLERPDDPEKREERVYQEWIDDVRPAGSLIEVNHFGEVFNTRTIGSPQKAINGYVVLTRDGVFNLMDCKFISAT